MDGFRYYIPSYYLLIKKLTNVRIPRENMLMKWSQLSKDGIFSEPPNAQLAYGMNYVACNTFPGSLITERVGAVRGTFDLIDQAITVAVRYGRLPEDRVNL